MLKPIGKSKKAAQKVRSSFSDGKVNESEVKRDAQKSRKKAVAQRTEYGISARSWAMEKT
jgi:hypothetical protein